MMKPKNMNVVDDPIYWGVNFNEVPEDDDLDIDNILDFSDGLEEDNSLLEEDWNAKFQSLGPVSEALQGLHPGYQLLPGFWTNNSFPVNTISELKQQPEVVDISSTGKFDSSDAKDLSLVQEESPIFLSDTTSELKQLPGTDVLELSSTCEFDSSDAKVLSLFQTESPISVLESSSSCSAEKRKSASLELLVPVRTRSKRPRPSTSPWFLISPTTLSNKISNKKVEKKKKLSQLSCILEIDEDPLNQSIPTKRCTHCQVSKTPQWREGPMGPKTLCNACGVRYRSGRLFPEYRPAASPTFVPSLHSNSHKKVIEMRNKFILEPYMPEAGPAISTCRNSFQ